MSHFMHSWQDGSGKEHFFLVEYTLRSADIFSYNVTPAYLLSASQWTARTSVGGDFFNLGFARYALGTPLTPHQRRFIELCMGEGWGALVEDDWAWKVDRD